jgi:hypothetical protein
MVTETMSAANRKIAVFLNVKDARELFVHVTYCEDGHMPNPESIEQHRRWRGAIVEALAKAAEEKTTGVNTP